MAWIQCAVASFSHLSRSVLFKSSVNVADAVSLARFGEQRRFPVLVSPRVPWGFRGSSRTAIHSRHGCSRKDEYYCGEQSHFQVFSTPSTSHSCVLLRCTCGSVAPQMLPATGAMEGRKNLYAAPPLERLCALTSSCAVKARPKVRNPRPQLFSCGAGEAGNSRGSV